MFNWRLFGLYRHLNGLPYRQFQVPESVVLIYLALQFLMAVTEFLSGKKRRKTNAVIIGTTILCLFIMEFGFFGPTQAPTNHILTSFTGLIMVMLVMFQTNAESVTAIEMAFMIALYCVNGTAFLMMSPVALMFSNILMAGLILLYGLIFALPVSGLPVFAHALLSVQECPPDSTGTHTQPSTETGLRLCEAVLISQDTRALANRSVMLSVG